MTEPVLPTYITIILKKALAAFVAGVFLFNDVAFAADFQNLATPKGVLLPEVRQRYEHVYKSVSNEKFRAFVKSAVEEAGGFANLEKRPDRIWKNGKKIDIKIAALPNFLEQMGVPCMLFAGPDFGMPVIFTDPDPQYYYDEDVLRKEKRDISLTATRKPKDQSVDFKKPPAISRNGMEVEQEQSKAEIKEMSPAAQFVTPPDSQNPSDEPSAQKIEFIPSFLANPIEEGAWIEFIKKLFINRAPVENLRRFVRMVDETWGEVDTRQEVIKAVELVALPCYSSAVGIIAAILATEPVENWLSFLSSEEIFQVANELAQKISEIRGEADPWKMITKSGSVGPRGHEKTKYRLQMPRNFFGEGYYNVFGRKIHGFVRMAAANLNFKHPLDATLCGLDNLKEHPLEAAPNFFILSDADLSSFDHSIERLNDILNSLPRIEISGRKLLPNEGNSLFVAISDALVHLPFMGSGWENAPMELVNISVPAYFVKSKDNLNIIRRMLGANFRTVGLVGIMRAVFYELVDTRGELVNKTTNLAAVGKKTVEVMESALEQSRQSADRAKRFGYKNIHFKFYSISRDVNLELLDSGGRIVCRSYYHFDSGMWTENWDDESVKVDKAIAMNTAHGYATATFTTPKVLLPPRRLSDAGNKIFGIAERFARSCAAGSRQDVKSIHVSIGTNDKLCEDYAIQSCQYPFGYDKKYGKCLPPTHSMLALFIDNEKGTSIFKVPLFLLAHPDAVDSIAVLLEHNTAPRDLIKFFNEHYLNEEEISRLRLQLKDEATKAIQMAKDDGAAGGSDGSVYASMLGVGQAKVIIEKHFVQLAKWVKVWLAKRRSPLQGNTISTDAKSGDLFYGSVKLKRGEKPIDVWDKARVNLWAAKARYKILQKIEKLPHIKMDKYKKLKRQSMSFEDFLLGGFRNALDSIAFRFAHEDEHYNSGVIEVRAYVEGENIIVDMIDDGAGDVENSQNAWKNANKNSLGLLGGKKKEVHYIYADASSMGGKAELLNRVDAKGAILRLRLPILNKTDLDKVAQTMFPVWVYSKIGETRIGKKPDGEGWALYMNLLQITHPQLNKKESKGNSREESKGGITGSAAVGPAMLFIAIPNLIAIAKASGAWMRRVVAYFNSENFMRRFSPRYWKTYSHLEGILKDEVIEYAKLAPKDRKMREKLKQQASLVTGLKDLQDILIALMHELRQDDLSRFPTIEAFYQAIDEITSAMPEKIRIAGKPRISSFKKEARALMSKRLAQREKELAAAKLLEDAKTVIAETRECLQVASNVSDCDEVLDDFRLAVKSAKFPAQLQGDIGQLIGEIEQKRKKFELEEKRVDRLEGVLLKASDLQGLEELINGTKGNIPLSMYEKMRGISDAVKDEDIKKARILWAEFSKFLGGLIARKQFDEDGENNISPVIEKLKDVGVIKPAKNTQDRRDLPDGRSVKSNSHKGQTRRGVISFFSGEPHKKPTETAATELDTALSIISKFRNRDFRFEVSQKKITALLAYQGSFEKGVHTFVKKSVLNMARSAQRKRPDTGRILGLAGEVSGLYEVLIKRLSTLRDINLGRLESVDSIVYGKGDTMKEFDAVNDNTVFEFKFHLTLRKLYQQVIGMDREHTPHLKVLTKDRRFNKMRNIVYFGEADDGQVGKALVKFIEQRPELKARVFVTPEGGLSVKLTLLETKEFLSSPQTIACARAEERVHRMKFLPEGFPRKYEEMRNLIDTKIRQLNGQRFDVIIALSRMLPEDVNNMNKALSSLTPATATSPQSMQPKGDVKIDYRGPRGDSGGYLNTLIKKAADAFNIGDYQAAYDKAREAVSWFDRMDRAETDDEQLEILEALDSLEPGPEEMTDFNEVEAYQARDILSKAAEALALPKEFKKSAIKTGDKYTLPPGGYKKTGVSMRSLRFRLRKELRGLSEEVIAMLRNETAIGDRRKILVDAGLDVADVIDGKFLLWEVDKFLQQRPPVVSQTTASKNRILRHTGRPGRHLIAYSADDFTFIVKVPIEPEKTDDVVRFWVRQGYELARERLKGLAVPTMVIDATGGSKKKPFSYMLEKSGPQKSNLSIIQKKVVPVFGYLKNLVKEGKVSEAKTLIDKYKEFVIAMFRRGVIDTDFNNPYWNYGLDLDNGEILAFDFGDLVGDESDVYRFFEMLRVANKYFYDDLRTQVGKEVANYFKAIEFQEYDFYNEAGELLFGIDLKTGNADDFRMTFPYDEDTIRHFFMNHNIVRAGGGVKNEPGERGFGGKNLCSNLSALFPPSNSMDIVMNDVAPNRIGGPLGERYWQGPTGIPSAKTPGPNIHHSSPSLEDPKLQDEPAPYRPSTAEPNLPSGKVKGLLEIPQKFSERLLRAAENKPADELINIFHLEDALEIAPRGVTESGMRLYQVRTKEPTNVFAHPLHGMEVFQHELGRVSRFDLVLNNRDELIAVFPAELESSARKEPYGYFDFSHCYVPMSLLSDFTPNAKNRWQKVASDMKANRELIDEYRDSPLCLNSQAANVWRSGEQSPFVYIEIDRESGETDLVPFEPSDLDAQHFKDENRNKLEFLYTERPNVERTVFIVLPTVYSPAFQKYDLSAGVHFMTKDGLAIPRFLFKSIRGASLISGESILDVATGTGYLLFIDWVAAQKRKDIFYHAVDINPMAVAAARANLKAAGIQADVRLYNNLWNPETGDAFENRTEFKVVTCGSPFEDDKDLQSVASLSDLHDGFHFMSFLKEGLIRSLAGTGTAYVWSWSDIKYGMRHQTDPAYRILNEGGSLKANPGLQTVSLSGPNKGRDYLFVVQRTAKGSVSEGATSPNAPTVPPAAETAPDEGAAAATMISKSGVPQKANIRTNFKPLIAEVNSENGDNIAKATIRLMSRDDIERFPAAFKSARGFDYIKDALDRYLNDPERVVLAFEAGAGGMVGGFAVLCADERREWVIVEALITRYKARPGNPDDPGERILPYKGAGMLLVAAAAHISRETFGDAGEIDVPRVSEIEDLYTGAPHKFYLGIGLKYRNSEGLYNAMHGDKNWIAKILSMAQQKYGMRAEPDEDDAATDREAAQSDTKAESASTPAEVLMAIRGDGDDDELLTAAMGEGVTINAGVAEVLENFGIIEQIDRKNGTDAVVSFTKMMRDSNSNMGYTRNTINLATSVITKFNGKSADFVKEILRARMVDYTYRKIKEPEAAQETQIIRIWNEYGANSQIGTMQEVARRTDDKIKFESLENLVKFAEDSKDGMVAILPRNKLTKEQKERLDKPGIRVMYVDFEKRDLAAGELGNLEGLVGIGRAYLSDDEESFYKLYNILVEKPVSDHVSLAELKTNPIYSIDRLKFILRPIKPNNINDLPQINRHLKKLLLSA